jgi:hypothetical protein
MFMWKLSHGFQDNAVPVLFEVQEGFVWPHFILNEAVLLSAGFTNISADIRFNIFRFNLGHWTTVKINHVVELKDSPRIFVKAIHVQHCQDFAKFLLSTSLSTTSPNIRTNLAGERTYVKKKMVEYELSRSRKSLFLKNKHTLSQSPENLPSTPKRQRIMSDETPTPTPTRYRAPNPISGAKFTRKLAPAATRSIKEKAPAAARGRELIECSDSDPFEFSDPISFNTPSSAPSISRSASAASTSTATSSDVSFTVKQETLGSTIPSLPFLISTTRISQKLKWPADFFAIKIAECFDEIEDNATDARVRMIFEHHFGQWVSYKRSTFYEHRQRWVRASLEAKNAVLAAGHTKAGCWVNFMSMTAAPRAHVKAARKRNAKFLLDCEVINISSGSEHEA